MSWGWVLSVLLWFLCTLPVASVSPWAWQLAVGQQSAAGSQVSQTVLRLTALGLVKRKQCEAEGPMQCTLQSMEILVDLSGSWI